MTRVPCRACQKRRKLLETKLLAKQAKGKKVQAAAIGAVLTTTALVGRLIGEEGENERARTEDSGSSEGVAGRTE